MSFVFLPLICLHVARAGVSGGVRRCAGVCTNIDRR